MRQGPICSLSSGHWLIFLARELFGFDLTRDAKWPNHCTNNNLSYNRIRKYGKRRWKVKRTHSSTSQIKLLGKAKIYYEGMMMKDPFLKIWDHGVLNQISNRVEVSATNRISSCPSPPSPPFGSIRVAHYHHSDAKCCSPLEKRKPQEDEQRVCVLKCNVREPQ